MRPTKGFTGRRWRTARYGTAALAVLTLGVASACSSGGSPKQWQHRVYVRIGVIVVGDGDDNPIPAQ